MVRRCYNPKVQNFKNYGGRGIAVCDEWRHQPVDFIKWCESLGNIPIDHTIDRIDNDGPYSPDNCRFSSNIEQSRNKRTNVFIEHNGEILCFTDFVQKYGVVSIEQAKQRVYRNGFSYKDAALIKIRGAK